MSKQTELASLLGRALALRSLATLHPTAGHGLCGVECNSLTVVFHDAHPSQPKSLPPLYVKISDDGENVFYGAVDPDNISHCKFSKWKRGDWEKRLGSFQ